MVKNHLKRINAPKTWNIERKKTTFVARPNPGGQPFLYTITLSVLLKESLNLFQTRKELRYALNKGDILVNQTPRKNPRFPVSIFDSVSIPVAKKHFLLIIDRREKLVTHPIPEKQAEVHVCKIIRKTTTKGGKIQLGTMDGRTFLVDNKDYRTGDSLQIELPSQKILTHLKFETGAHAFIFKGSHTGKIVTIADTKGATIHFTEEGQNHETKKEYAIIVDASFKP